MTPIEFTLWLNGAVGVLGDQPPTPEQWIAIREKMGEAVGQIVSSKLLEHAEDVRRQQEKDAKAEVEKRLIMEQMQAMKLEAQKKYAYDAAVAKENTVYGVLSGSGVVAMQDYGLGVTTEEHKSFLSKLLSANKAR